MGAVAASTPRMSLDNSVEARRPTEIDQELQMLQAALLHLESVVSKTGELTSPYRGAYPENPREESKEAGRTTMAASFLQKQRGMVMHLIDTLEAYNRGLAV